MITNGCNFFYEGPWDTCCDIHDIAFANGGNLIDMVKGNIALFECVFPSHPIAATILFAGVTIGGWFFFEWTWLHKLGIKNFYQLFTGKSSDGKF